MTADHKSTRPFACVAFLAIPDFAKRAVAEQVQLRSALEPVVAGVVASLPEQDRIVIDAPGGAAIAVLSDSAGALAVAELAHASAAGLPLVVGLSHGRIGELADARNTSVVAGDGIDTAALIARVGKAGTILMSREFKAVLSREAVELKAAIREVGTITDSRQRTYETFAFERARIGARFRRQLVIAFAAGICLLGLGVGVNRLRHRVVEIAPSTRLQTIISPAAERYGDRLPVRSNEVARLLLSPGQQTIETLRVRS